jgi:hypothetical protein
MPITIDNEKIIINSPFYRRDIDIAGGPFCCEIFSRAPGTETWLGSHHRTGWGIPFEAAVKVGDEWLEVGINRHKCYLWQNRGSVFQVKDARISKGEFGPQVAVACRPPESFPCQLEVTVYYEISEELPFFRKWVEVRNIGDKELVVNNIVPEIFYSRRMETDILALHDFRNETKHNYPVYSGYFSWAFPADIEAALPPGGSLESFKLYQVFTPNSHEGRSVWKSRVLKRIMPNPPVPEIIFQASGVKPESGHGVPAFLNLIDRCAAAGIETLGAFVDQLWSNIGDYVPRKDLFPNGFDDLKQVIDYAHKKGMRIATYASYSIAWRGSEVRENHQDWECVGPDGEKFDPAAWGNMCFLSGWGDCIMKKITRLAELGFDRFDIDGPTEIPCCDRRHQHTSIGNYEYRNWLWEKTFYRELAKRRVTATVPRGENYLLMGASLIPGGYFEEDFCHASGMELVNNYRRTIYQARYSTPAWGTWGFVALGEYHGHSIELDEARPYILDHALGGFFGYGHCSALTGEKFFCGPETEAVFRKWIDFYRKRRTTLQGDFIHLAAPDGQRPDAVMHTNSAAAVPAVAVVFNPVEKVQTVNLNLPLEYAGFSPGEKISISGSGANVLDDRAAVSITLELKPFEVRIIEITLESRQ